MDYTRINSFTEFIPLKKINFIIEFRLNYTYLWRKNKFRWTFFSFISINSPSIVLPFTRKKPPSIPKLFDWLCRLHTIHIIRVINDKTVFNNSAGVDALYPVLPPASIHVVAHTVFVITIVADEVTERGKGASQINPSVKPVILLLKMYFLDC